MLLLMNNTIYNAHTEADTNVLGVIMVVKINYAMSFSKSKCYAKCVTLQDYLFLNTAYEIAPIFGHKYGEWGRPVQCM